MKKSKRVMRLAILSKLFDCLEERYAVGYTRENLVSARLSLRDIDALLAFKSDPRIDELRNALERIDEGTYGVCFRCKGSIPQSILDADPAQRFCLTCQQEISHSVVEQFRPHTTA